MWGFSLIELMISIVIGMIVVGGAISLIVAINQSNSETIQSTRLTQELRALASVVADDVKRMRFIEDPAAMVGQGTTTACPTASAASVIQPCYAVTVTNCPGLSYGYSGTTSDQSLYNYHQVRLDRTTGRVSLDYLTLNPTGVTTVANLPTSSALQSCPITNSTTAVLSSSQIKITDLTFTVVSANEIDLSVTGSLVSGDSYTNSISRTFKQPIFIRSTTVN
ncbi:MAG TPA: prepilin-type N-terminal cleavage/methylation domain-containing protein [Rudaea sp.]